MKGHGLWKDDRLGADSMIYRTKSDIYEQFSQAEDSPNRIVSFLKPLLKDKIVLDLGCGTGKFISAFAPVAKQYYGIELLSSQLRIADRKAKKYSNVKLINCSAENIPLESDTIDFIFSSWFIGSIHDISLRKRINKEINRILKKDGSVYVIENDIGGEFKNLIEKDYGEEKTKIKLDWLEKEGFVRVKTIESFFEFESLDSARNLFAAIWGRKKASKINHKRISHNIVIYKNGP